MTFLLYHCDNIVIRIEILISYFLRCMFTEESIRENQVPFDSHWIRITQVEICLHLVITYSIIILRKQSFAINH